MLKNYIKIGLRSIRRYPVYSLINLVGLGVGMACCLLILVFVQHEYGVNQHFEKAESIYRVNSVWHKQGDDVRLVSFSPLAPTLKREYAGVKNTYRYTGISADIRVGNEPFRVPALIVGPEMFELFDFAFVDGNAATALREPNTVVLTEPEAIKLFGRTEVVGEEINVSTWGNDGEKVYNVSAVIEQPPYNSVTFIGQSENRVFIPFLNANDFFEGVDFDGDWSVANTVTYLELDEGIQSSTIEDQLPPLLEQHLSPELRGTVSLQLEPMKDVYLNDFGGGARQLANMLLIVALLILGIACFNYINVSTALASARAKEVGMRKMMGASKRQLISQYLGESVLICSLGMLISIGFSQLALHPFNELVERSLSLGYTSFQFWLLITGIVLVTGVMGGAYPAFYLAGVKPLKSIKILAGTGKKVMGIRRGLVLVQFTLAIGLLASAFVIHRQAVFIAEQETGFDKEQVLAISSLPREWSPAGVQKLEVIKRAVQEVPGVEQVSIAWGPPGPRYTGVTEEFIAQGGDESNAISIPISQVDASFLETMGIELTEGAFFDPEQEASEQVVVLNEAAVRAFGWDAPIDQYITAGDSEYRVVGVVKDYYTAGLEQDIAPLALMDVRQYPIYRELLIRLSAQEASQHLADIQNAWSTVYPNVAFEYYFLDQQWHDAHQWIWRTQLISRLATLLTLFIACLGLFGVVSISVAQRKREIGIRKVVGASTHSLLRLLSLDFLKLVLFAFIVATPLVVIMMHRWLQAFASRISLVPADFVGAGFLVLVMAGCTIGLLALRAANMNPVDTLRQE